MTSSRLASILFVFVATICVVFQDGVYAKIVYDQVDDGDSGPNQVCQPFSCPKPTVPIDKWPLGIVSTGCQSGSGMAMMTAGGKKQYKHIEHCCHIKNACYQLCGSNKQRCDAEMDKCMDKGCEDLPDSTPDEIASMSDEELEKEKKDCDQMKSITKLIANMGGCNEYDAMQRQHCECVDKGKMEEKMERVFRNFYKKFNPDGIDKVKGLLEKAAGKRANFNKILYSLVKKYPAAIKKKVVEMPDPLKMDL